MSINLTLNEIYLPNDQKCVQFKRMTVTFFLVAVVTQTYNFQRIQSLGDDSFLVTQRNQKSSLNNQAKR